MNEQEFRELYQRNEMQERFDTFTIKIQYLFEKSSFSLNLWKSEGKPPLYMVALVDSEEEKIWKISSDYDQTIAEYDYDMVMVNAGVIKVQERIQKNREKAVFEVGKAVNQTMNKVYDALMVLEVEADSHGYMEAALKQLRDVQGLVGNCEECLIEERKL